MTRAMSYYAVIFAALTVAACGTAPTEYTLEKGDWPQYRADSGRTGYTPSVLPDKLFLKWSDFRTAPDPAWTGIHTRMTFDHAYQPVVGGTSLFFGSTSDDKIYALDTETGEEQWSFFTGSPVRFAPALWNGRVYAASDDGILYCLDAGSGGVVWSKNLARTTETVLGNDRIVSRRPVRGGPVIRDGVLYVGAGIWPSEGIFLYALDPSNGEERWVNDDSGGMLMDQPHPGARSHSGISAQGYLLAADGKLIVPTGRSVPAAFDISDGSFKYFHLQKFRTYGGSRVMAAGGYIFAPSGNTRFEWEIIGRTNAVFSTADGELATTDEFNSPGLAASPTELYYVDSRERTLAAFDLASLTVTQTATAANGTETKRVRRAPPLWTVPIHEPEAVSIIVAGDKVVIGTLNGKVTIVDAAQRSVVWSAEVDGVPYGLAVARGNLYVGTDTGMLYCFGANAPAQAKSYTLAISGEPYGENALFSDAAEAIVGRTGITEGWCLDIGCGDGELAYELARRTNLSIVAVDSDPAAVARAREKLDSAGLYGTRVTVLCADPADTKLPQYFANLVVSGRSVKDGAGGFGREEAFRCRRPAGGVCCIGQSGSFELTTRESLAGSGEWTHLYSNPANTINSGDEIVRGDLAMLWFRDSDYEMPSRHGRGVGPLYKDGRMFVQGNHGIRAYDAYNGTVLWDYFIEDLQKPYDQEHLLGAAITQGNWCVEGDRLYVRVSEQMAGNAFRVVLALDTVTGNIIRRYRIPAGPDGNSRGYWGYLAIQNGTLFGTVVNHEHITKWGYLESNMSSLYSEARAFFALDADTGELKWMYKARDSVRHNAIAIGNGHVYLIDRPIFKDDYLYSGGGRGPAPNAKTVNHPGGTLLSLDADTGKVLARTSDNIYGTLLALSTEHDILVMTYQYTRFKLTSEVGGRMAAFRASDLSRVWDVATGIESGSDYTYYSRPIINGGTVYFEPYAFELATGDRTDFAMSRTYNCGIVTGSKYLLAFRSGTLGFVDVSEPDEGTRDYGGIRPGCWINALPVGGMVLMPDATARCNCSYLMNATIALAPRVSM